LFPNSVPGSGSTPTLHFPTLLITAGLTHQRFQDQTCTEWVRYERHPKCTVLVPLGAGLGNTCLVNTWYDRECEDISLQYRLLYI